jgi:hypothetical protein
MKAIKSKSVRKLLSAAGEHFVMHQLLKRKLIAGLAPEGANNCDIIITDIYCKNLCTIQVKTTYDAVKNQNLKWRLSEKHETLVTKTLFYCFVNCSPSSAENPKCYIVPSSKVAEVIKISHQTYLAGNPKRKNSPLRWLKVHHNELKNSRYEKKYSQGWLDEYLERWDLLIKKI